MSIPTTPLKFPLDGNPVDKDGNWTPTWHRAMQGLFTRTGANVAPSNLQLAAAIAANIVGSGGSTDGDVAVYSGTTGLVVHDTGVKAASLVAGPASATDSDIALFNGITGKLIKDSGIQLTSLASLASPPLTGTPTAPTAAAGTNTTQIATTAFVTTAVAAAGTTASSFSAHNNGTAQSIPNGAWTKLTWSTTAFNVGSNFTPSAWTPPANRLVMLMACVSLPSALNALCAVAIYKNGGLYKQGVMTPAGGANSVQATVTCVDIPNGTDFYEVYAFQNTGSSQNTNGASTNTYYQGTSIQA